MMLFKFYPGPVSWAGRPEPWIGLCLSSLVSLGLGLVEEVCGAASGILGPQPPPIFPPEKAHQEGLLRITPRCTHFRGEFVMNGSRHLPRDRNQLLSQEETFPLYVSPKALPALAHSRCFIPAGEWSKPT